MTRANRAVRERLVRPMPDDGLWGWGAPLLIAAFAGIFFVIPPLMNILPTNWNQSISEYLPSSAARDVFALTHGAHDLAPGPGIALCCLYTAFAIAVAAVLLVRRDA